jgi:hypothetical protein
MKINIIKGPHFERNLEKAQRMVAEIIREKAKEIERSEQDGNSSTNGTGRCTA